MVPGHKSNNKIPKTQINTNIWMAQECFEKQNKEPKVFIQSDQASMGFICESHGCLWYRLWENCGGFYTQQKKHKILQKLI